MWAISPTTRIFLAAGVTDMRMGYNGLSALVENSLGQQPTSGHLYAFCNRRRNRLKVLYWDGSGLIVCSKRLEKGRFSWTTEHGTHQEFSREKFLLLFSGLEVENIKEKPWYRH
jgi:transposase